MSSTQKKNIPVLRFPEFEGEWGKGKMSSLLTIRYGKDYKHLDKGEVPVLGTGGVMTYVSDFLYDKPSVLIGRKGTIDKPKYIDEPFWTVDTMFYSEIDPDYEPYFVYLIAANVNWLKFNEATGVPSLNTKSINSVDVFAPNSKPEQQKIADFLSAVDKRIRQLTHKKELLEQYKKGVMQQLFNQQIRFKDDNGKNYPDWEEKRLGEVLAIPQKNRPAEIAPDKILTVKLHLKGVQKNEKTDNLSLGATNYYIRKEGQFIYGKQNIFNGALGIVPSELDGYLSSADVPTLDINNNRAYSLYIYYYFGRKHFYNNLEALSSGSGSKRIHENTILKLKVKLPSKLEQLKIANYLSSIDDKITQVNTQIAQTQSFKKGLLQQMFV